MYHEDGDAASGKPWWSHTFIRRDIWMELRRLSSTKEHTDAPTPINTTGASEEHLTAPSPSAYHALLGVLARVAALFANAQRFSVHQRGSGKCETEIDNDGPNAKTSAVPCDELKSLDEALDDVLERLSSLILRHDAAVAHLFGFRSTSKNDAAVAADGRVWLFALAMCVSCWTNLAGSTDGGGGGDVTLCRLLRRLVLGCWSRYAGGTQSPSVGRVDGVVCLGNAPIETSTPRYLSRFLLSVSDIVGLSMFSSSTEKAAASGDGGASSPSDDEPLNTLFVCFPELEQEVLVYVTRLFNKEGPGSLISVFPSSSSTDDNANDYLGASVAVVERVERWFDAEAPLLRWLTSSRKLSVVGHIERVVEKPLMRRVWSLLLEDLQGPQHVAEAPLSAALHSMAMQEKLQHAVRQIVDGVRAVVRRARSWEPKPTAADGSSSRRSLAACFLDGMLDMYLTSAVSVRMGGGGSAAAAAPTSLRRLVVDAMSESCVSTRYDSNTAEAIALGVSSFKTDFALAVPPPLPAAAATAAAAPGSAGSATRDDAATAAANARLMQLFEASPASFLIAFLRTTTAPVAAPQRLDYDHVLFVADASPKLDSLALHWGAAEDRKSLQGVNAFAAFFFGRLVAAYKRLEEFLGRIVADGRHADANGAMAAGVSDAIARHVLRQVLVASCRPALQCLATESGSPCAVDHLMFFVFLAQVHRAEANLPFSTDRLASQKEGRLLTPLLSEIPTAVAMAQMLFPVVEAEASLDVPPAVATESFLSMQWLHSQVTRAQSRNLFGFWAPVFQTLSMNMQFVREESDIYLQIGEQHIAPQLYAFQSKSRPLLFFPNMASAGPLTGGLSVSVCQSRHALQFLKEQIFTHERTLAEFVDVVVEAAGLFAVRMTRVSELALQRCAVADADLAMALFFSVLRFVACGADPVMDGYISSECRRRLGERVFEQIEAAANLRPAVKAHLRGYRPMALGMPPQAPPAIVPPPDSPVEDSLSSTALAPITAPSAAEDTPNTTAENRSSVLPEPAAAVDSVPPAAVTTPTTDGEPKGVNTSDIDASRNADDKPIVVHSTPAAADGAAVSAAEDGNSDGAAAATVVASTENAPPPPSSPVPPFAGPHPTDNDWVRWFWTVDVLDFVPLETFTEKRKETLREFISSTRVPGSCLAALKNDVNVVEKELVARRQEQAQQNLCSFWEATVRPALAAGHPEALRPFVYQVAHELVLRAMLSLPDAFLCFRVLEAVLRLAPAASASSAPVLPKPLPAATMSVALGAGAVSLATPSNPAAGGPSAVLPPSFVVELLNRFLVALTAHLQFASKTGLRSLSYLLGQVVRRIIFPWRAAMVTPPSKAAAANPSRGSANSVLPAPTVSAHGAGQGGALLGVPGGSSSAAATPSYTLLMPTNKDLEMLRMAFTCTTNVLLQFLQAASPHGDLGAAFLKSQCRDWLGLSAFASQKIQEQEKVRLEQAGDASKHTSSPLYSLVKMTWTFSKETPQPVTDVKFLFLPPRGSGGAAAHTNASASAEKPSSNGPHQSSSAQKEGNGKSSREDGGNRRKRSRSRRRSPSKQRRHRSSSRRDRKRR